MLAENLCHKVIGKEGLGEVMPNQNDILYGQTVKTLEHEFTLTIYHLLCSHRRETFV